MKPLKCWQTAVREEAPLCLVCEAEVLSLDDLICSATCSDMFNMLGHGSDYEGEMADCD